MTAYAWDAVFGSRRGGWVETRHSTACGLNSSGHSTCTCEPKLIAHPLGALVGDVRHRGVPVRGRSIFEAAEEETDG
jgi:hypothetical protein